MPGKGRADWQSEELLRTVRELQPHILVDNRLDLPASQADFHTPEQVQPSGWVHVEGVPVVWEACHTLGGAWGYRQDCRFTQTSAEQARTGGARLYLHIYAWPFRHLHLSGLAGKVSYAEFVHDGSEVQLARLEEWEMDAQARKDTLLLELPVRRPDVTVPVIELFLND